MKAFLLSVIFTVVTVFCASAQVGIGTTNPNSSSMLDVSSTNSGLLVPRMTSAQRVAIPSPATGLMVYQTNGTPGLYYNTGTPAAPSWTFAGSSTGQWLTNGSKIYYNNGNVGIGTSDPLKLFSIKSGVISDDMLTLYSADNEYLFRIRQNSNGSGGVYVYDSNNVCNAFLYGDGDSYIRGGNFGVGTNAPVTPLDVRGTTSVTSGYLGVGTTAPSAGLHVKGTSFPATFIYIEGAAGDDAGIRLYEAGTVKWHLFNDVGYDGLNILNNAGVTVLFAKQSNGFVGVGTTAPATLFDVRGNLSVNNSGRIGIGTTAPQTPLDVHGNASLTGGQLGIGTISPGAGLHVKGTAFPNSFIFIEGSSNTDAGIRLYEGTTAQWHIFHDASQNGLNIYNSAAETAIFCKNSDGYVGIGHTAPERQLDVKGNMVVRNATTNDIVVELGTGLDYAEGFNTATEDSPEPGTVMSIDPDNPGMLMVCSGEYDHKVAGIVAGANSLGSGIILGSGSHQVNVALAGRVYCKADATNEAIDVGVLLTTSALPGYAKRAGPGEKVNGAILGKAMEGLAKGQRGQILVLVSLQ
jgi:hypothetical protein